MAYYNEIEPFAAAWLRDLIVQGIIAPGDVDERSIKDVSGDDLRDYTQCHFFAGIGVWSFALRLAGWPDDAPVWTGSCPCQPFSAAGKGEGADDHRHLWPSWFRLVRERRPGVVFGEQVAGKDGRAWLDVVSTDLEGIGYAVGPADLCAAGVGAPHIRQRLFFVAESNGGDAIAKGLQRGRNNGQRAEDSGAGGRPALSESRVVGDTVRAERKGRSNGSSAVSEVGTNTGRHVGEPSDSSHRELGNALGGRRQVSDVPIRSARQEQAAAVERGASVWSPADWIPCADGEARPVEPGTFPLAHGAPARLGRLRAYGNAIVAEVAASFIEAYLDVRGGVNA